MELYHLKQQRDALVKELNSLRGMVKQEQNKLDGCPQDDAFRDIDREKETLREKEALLNKREVDIDEKQRIVSAELANNIEFEKKHLITLDLIKAERKELVKDAEQITYLVDLSKEIRKENETKSKLIEIASKQASALSASITDRLANLKEKEQRMTALGEDLAELGRRSKKLDTDINTKEAAWIEKKKDIDEEIAKHDATQKDIADKYKDIEEQHAFFKDAHTYLAEESKRKEDHIKKLYLELREESKRRKIEGIVPEEGGL